MPLSGCLLLWLQDSLLLSITTSQAKPKQGSYLPFISVWEHKIKLRCEGGNSLFKLKKKKPPKATSGFGSVLQGYRDCIWRKCPLTQTSVKSVSGPQDPARACQMQRQKTPGFQGVIIARSPTFQITTQTSVLTLPRPNEVNCILNSDIFPEI